MRADLVVVDVGARRKLGQARAERREVSADERLKQTAREPELVQQHAVLRTRGEGCRVVLVCWRRRGALTLFIELGRPRSRPDLRMW